MEKRKSKGDIDNLRRNLRKMNVNNFFDTEFENKPRNRSNASRRGKRANNKDRSKDRDVDLDKIRKEKIKMLQNKDNSNQFKLTESKLQRSSDAISYSSPSRSGNPRKKRTSIFTKTSEIKPKVKEESKLESIMENARKKVFKPESWLKIKASKCFRNKGTKYVQGKVCEFNMPPHRNIKKGAIINVVLHQSCQEIIQEFVESQKDQDAFISVKSPVIIMDTPGIRRRSIVIICDECFPEEDI
ncbi:unnamed protein product [Moneuplotes crassus]|uniref:Uncharacterized protein n=2 Tax=Euplotes crassus TaxID=5936 RepID=A0AAD2D2R9_EUPCR|nr:unnamed protein product [Moneuplotes crassus]